MSQHDYVIENQTFPATRTDINNALAAVASTNAGSSAPSTTYAHQLWYDTTANKLKQRNADNDAWIDLFDVDQTTDTAALSSGDFAGNVTVTGDLTVDTNTLHVDATNNRVGIGTTSPATATGGGIDIQRAGGASVRLEDTTNSVTGEMQVYSAGMNLATVTNHNIIISPNNSEIARFTTDGLTFNGDTAAANALADFEFGTWTPSVGGSATYSAANYGRYTKIGNIVSLTFALGINAIGTGNTAAILNLPFTSENIGQVQSGCISYFGSLTVAVNFFAFYIHNNSTSTGFVGNTGNFGTIALNGFAPIGNNTSIYCSITYRAA